jgi:hypothetical protein
MLAWRRYQRSLCPGCGHPKATAWHPDNAGNFEGDDPITCHACTQLEYAKAKGDVDVDPVTYGGVHDTRDYELDPLPDIDDVT